MDIQPFRIFLASPGDVQDERNLARTVIDQIRHERAFRRRVDIEVVAWDQPGAAVAMDAGLTPQEAIKRGLPKPSDCDLVVVILWSRMGTPLPDEYRKADGSPYLSGTEWEYEDAMAAPSRPERPAVWIYRRAQAPTANFDDPDFDHKRTQWAKVQSFLERFTHANGSPAGGINPYQTPEDFRTAFERHLRDHLTGLIEKQTPHPAASPVAKVHQEEAPFLGGRVEIMADIFISYAREDLERVRPIVGAIERSGYSVFWDRRIPSGMTWRQYIGKALDDAKCVIVVWSKHSIDSKFVQEEADDGNEREILVPVLVDEVRPPLGFRSIQCEDFRSWNGDPDHGRVKSLLNSIERVTGKKPAPEKPLFKGKIDLSTLGQRGFMSKIAQHSASDRVAITNEVDGYELVKIPADTFMMGSPEDEKDRFENEGSPHEVHVPAFFMGRYPVTNAQYELFLKKNPKAPKPEYWADRDFNQPRQPVVGVTWEDARAYARWAGLRLPTEAEWEYACRANTRSRFYTGDEDADLDRAGWYEKNSKGSTHPVGEKEPNGFGLYDMHGNVWEWVEDDWHGTYDKAPPDGQAWIDDPRADGRVIRGGSWRIVARDCRSAARFFIAPGIRNFVIGFRLARSVALGP